MRLSVVTGLALLTAVQAVPPAAPTTPPMEPQEPTGVCLTVPERVRLSPEKQVDKLCFKCNLDEFDSEWDSPYRTPGFEWWTDGCTASPDEPMPGLNYTKSCRRHDFCYHTLKKQGRFYRNVKTEVDNIFFKDMNDACASVPEDKKKDTPWWMFWISPAGAAVRHVIFNCDVWANLYHISVDNFGKFETSLDDPPEGKEYEVVDGRVQEKSAVKA
ncbi:prokaryotic phospholipase A2 domain-containing protein [Hirsutella rhossiliensis]|uniref:Prokaryotic phospholipase a2 domain-containing protein n=1 Tax=Hirsutella rhossiliensis TaxID=111463 RepID=A0A9P8N5B3_9HYPO|nr:prokaryotic phospholipase a2 domain-containing protein [Hirsutella rhossiliensis]KAH0967903.1 prokaryotic phospholipase a2 domain-containing protein [Hirsutella rhossiliensis]